MAGLQIAAQQMPQDVQGGIAELVGIAEGRDRSPFKLHLDMPAGELLEPFYLKTFRRRVP